MSAPVGGSKGLYQVDGHSVATLLFFFLSPLLLVVFQFSVYPLKLLSHNRRVETHQAYWRRPTPNTNLDERGISTGGLFRVHELPNTPQKSEDISCFSPGTFSFYSAAQNHDQIYENVSFSHDLLRNEEQKQERFLITIRIFTGEVKSLI